MKKAILLCLALVLLTAGARMEKIGSGEAAVRYVSENLSARPATLPATVPATVPATLSATVPTTLPQPEIEPETTMMETELVYLYDFTEEEEELLLKIGMAERGNTGCTECIALVMRTVLNRVESSRFSSTIKGVIYAQDQFTPVMDGSFESAVPGWRCREALEMIKTGWDESQGALYYEWCEGESWHSQNLNLLLQHCDTRFYN